MSEVQGVAPLPVRPPMRPDEWPETYLVKVVRAHGVRRPLIYDINRIRSVLPWEVHERSTTSTRTRDYRNYVQGRPQYGSAPLPTWASLVRASSIRYCPLCYDEDPYIRNRWRFSSLLVCTTHGCHLKSNLYEPAFTFGRPSGKYEIAEASRGVVIEGVTCCFGMELRTARLVWSPFESQADEVQNPRLSEELGELAGWTITMWRLLEEVTRAHHKHVLREPVIDSLSGITRLVTDLRIEAYPSREGMLSLFSRLRHNVHAVAARRLLTTLRQSEDLAPTVLSRLPLLELTERLSAAMPQASRPACKGSLAFGKLQGDAMSFAEARHVLEPLGLGAEMLRQWIHLRVFRSVRYVQSGALKYLFIDRQEVKCAQRLLLSLVSKRDLMNEHQIESLTCEALQEIDLLRSRLLGMHSWFRRQDVCLLVNRLEEVSRPTPDASVPTWPLFSASTVQAAHQRAGFAELVEAALQSRFPVYRNLDRPGLSSFAIGAEAMVWLSHRRRAFFFERRRSRRSAAVRDMFEDHPSPSVPV